MSFFSRFRAPNVPQITTENSLVSANPKLVAIMISEINKGAKQPYFTALKNYIHKLNRAFTFIRLYPLEKAQILQYLKEAAAYTGEIQPYNDKLARSLFDYISLLSYSVKSESANIKRQVAQFAAQFPEIPDTSDDSLGMLKHRLNALKASLRGGTRKAKRSHTRKHRNRRKSRSVKKVSH